MPVIGYLGSNSHDRALPTNRFRTFQQGLNEAGYFEGRNVAVEYRWIEGRPDQLPGLAADLVGRQVAVIASLGGVPSTRAIKAATTTIPVVFQIGDDPVEFGFVASYARPGGNITGVSNLNAELQPKRLELLHELLPQARVIAFLVNSDHPQAKRQTTDLQSAARGFGVQIQILYARTERDFDAAFASAVQLRAGGLLIANMSPFTSFVDPNSVHWLPVTTFRRSTSRRSLPQRAAWSAIQPAAQRHSVWLASTSGAS